MLSTIVFLPTVAALLLLFVPKAYARKYTFAVSLVSLLLAVNLWMSFDGSSFLESPRHQQVLGGRRSNY